MANRSRRRAAFRLRVGTDCSGIEAPIQALRSLGVPHTHKFSSDIDKFCVRSIKANYQPEVLFGDEAGPFPNGDVEQRSIADVPDIDLYVCGFPCQPFSTFGKRRGFRDSRSGVFPCCLEVIAAKRPSAFVLENVPGLMTIHGGRPWEQIMKALRGLSYEVSSQVLDTSDFDIPHSRRRIYIVGLAQGLGRFEFPAPVAPRRSLRSFIDRRDRHRQEPPPSNLKRLTQAASRGAVFFDISHPAPPTQTHQRVAPCICADCCRYWNVPMGRRANVRELLQLQGFPVDFKRAVSMTQIKRQIGNAMSVNVVRAILSQLLPLIHGSLRRHCKESQRPP